MKSFSDNAFYLLFDAILRADRPTGSPSTWSAQGVSWSYSRHAFEGHDYGFAVEAYELMNTGKSGWTLLVVREHWWAGRYGDTMRSTHFAKPIRGDRSAIMTWLRQRQRDIEGTL